MAVLTREMILKELNSGRMEIEPLAPDQVGVKAKTGEGRGPVGQAEIIQAQCVALLRRI